METRPYRPPTDAEALWALKTGFELGLGSGTGDEEKRAVYEAKLTDDYRERYLDWVRWCIEREPNAVTMGLVDGEPVGYVFVLPETLAFVWDAAVLNEIYVDPDHRGSGLADALMDAAVGVARAQDLPMDRLVLDVDRENERARAFYDRHGFDHWGEMVARGL